MTTQTPILIEKLTPLQWSHTLNIKDKHVSDVVVVNKSFLYNLSKMPYREVHRILEVEKNKSPEAKTKLTKNLNSYFYGATALHFAILNPDFRVLEYVHKLYQELGVALDKNQYTKSYRKVKTAERDTLIFPGESYFNLAFKLADKQKMQYLKNENLDNFALPLFPQKAKHTYDDSDFTYQSNILSYCLQNCSGGLDNFSNLQQKLHYYLDFATSVAPLAQQLPSLLEQNYASIFMPYLLLYAPAYDNKDFQVHLPQFLCNYLQAFNSNNLLVNNRVVLNVHSVFEQVLKNMQQHPVDRNILNDIQRELKLELEKNYMKVTWFHKERDTLGKFLDNVKILKEKSKLDAKIVAPHNSKSTTLKKQQFKL